MLIIHGYLATRGSLHLLERRLTDRGLIVMSYPLGPLNVGDIRDSAGLIARKVESIVAQTGSRGSTSSATRWAASSVSTT